ncbi:MAG TPA: lysophospholipase [Rhizomicrobium sp.]|nr:lysophospholipase [Rhizomicrobium sp.]
MARSQAACAAGFALLGLLAACAPHVAKEGLENVKPAIERDAFLTHDGLRLPLRHWDAKSPIAIIVALHGMSDYSEAFEMPGTWWAQNGITTYAYDQRGFGKSPRPGLWAGGNVLRGDLDDFVDAARAKFPGVPVYALGESMGGAVVLTALASSMPPRADGIILVAPAVWSRDDMPWSYRAALWTVAHTAPWMTFTGRGLKIWPSDNIEMLRKLAHDPLFQHETRADAIYGLVNLMDEARRAPGHMTAKTPILFLYGANDQIIPKEPTEQVIRGLGKQAVVHRYAHGYHMLLRDLDAKKVWSDTLDWIASGRSATLN